MNARDELAAEITDLLLRFQWNRHAVKKRFKVGTLGMSQSHILLHLEHEPTATARELADALHLEESTLSRLIGSLVERGLIKKINSAADRRANTLEITPKGWTTIREINHAHAVMVGECVKQLSPSEQEELAGYLGELADRLGAFPLDSRPGVDHVVIELRRITRASGTLGSSFLGTSLSLARFYTLYFMANAGGPIELRDLAQLVPYDGSTVSRTVTALVRDGWARKDSASKDHRVLVLQLTPEGQERFQLELRAATNKIGSSLQHLSVEQLQHFITLLNTVENQDDVGDVLTIQDKLVVKRIVSDDERSQARAFLIQQLVERHLVDSSPEQLFAPHGMGYFLEINDSLRGVCGLHKREQDWVLDNFALELSSDRYLNVFLRNVFQDFFKRAQANDARLDPGLRLKCPPSVNAQTLHRFSAEWGT